MASEGARHAYLHRRTGLNVDVFADELYFCHRIPFKDRLDLDSPTICTTDLLLEKMQIVEINLKDFKDTVVLMLDHGEGLVTSFAHLTRALVREGDFVARGEPVALSGASGVNFIAALGFDPPHVHFNVWLDGRPVDPFARPGETSLWRSGTNAPGPAGEDSVEAAAWVPGDFDAAAIDALIAGCRSPSMRVMLDVDRATNDPAQRACRAIFYANYYPTRFPVRSHPYRTVHTRQPRLDLPFGASDYQGVPLPEVRPAEWSPSL